MSIRSVIRREVERQFDEIFAKESEPAFPFTPADPFGIDHDCLNPAGHDFIGSCGDVVCCHCSKVVWR